MAPDIHPTREDLVAVDAILRTLCDRYALDLSWYDLHTLRGQIIQRLLVTRSLDLTHYASQMPRDPQALATLYEDVLVVTKFFRNDAAWGPLERCVFPEIIERAASDRIRVWVAGCATGQEAYSIAMLLHEQLQAARTLVDFTMFGTDVHGPSLDVARAGVYPTTQLSYVTPARLARYFTPFSPGYQVCPALRAAIAFMPHDVTCDPPFAQLNLIACRNLLVYFQPHARRTILRHLHAALEPGGFLWLGLGDRIDGLCDGFDLVDEAAKIYRKRASAGDGCEGQPWRLHHGSR